MRVYEGIDRSYFSTQYWKSALIAVLIFNLTNGVWNEQIAEQIT